MGSNQAWLDGSYKVLFGDKVYVIASVKGENVWLDQLDDDAENEKKKRIWKAGAFEKTNEDIHAKTGAVGHVVKTKRPLKIKQECFLRSLGS